MGVYLFNYQCGNLYDSYKKQCIKINDTNINITVQIADDSK